MIKKTMYVLGSIDETFIYNMFSTLIEKMLTEKTIIDDTKALMLCHKSRLESKRARMISLLPSVNNLTIKNEFMSRGSFVNNDTLSQIQQVTIIDHN